MFQPDQRGDSMIMDESDFPVYQFLIKSGEPGIGELERAFETAKTGTDEERFIVGKMLLYVAFSADLGALEVPGLSKAAVEKELRSCVAVFDDLGSRNHPGGLAASGWCHGRGVGCRQDRALARDLLDRAERYGAPADLLTDVRNDLADTDPFKPSPSPRPPKRPSP
jgi:hypothetical protein